MTNKMLVPIIAILGMCLGFILGVRYAANADPRTIVTLQNNSAKDIEFIKIPHQEGLELVEELPSKNSKKVRFFAWSESGYSLYIRFKDGSILEGKGAYLEPGCEAVEQISESEVKTTILSPEKCTSSSLK